jgi:hypothetical protein
MFSPLNLPACSLKITQNGGEVYVFDEFRKKKLVLTPEEWVRQHLLHYLVRDLAYPKSLIAVEYGIKVNNLNRRCDIVIYSTDNKPIMIVECKASHISLNEDTFLQIAQYNFKLNVDFLLLTNGVQHIMAKINRLKNKLIYLEAIPGYADLMKPN